MNKQVAELWSSTITKLLSNRNLVRTTLNYREEVQVRTRQTFKKSYIVELSGDNYIVALCDTYGVMTGANEWNIDENQRTIIAKTTNSYGDPLQFLWTVDEDDSEHIYNEMIIARRELFKAMRK